MVRPVVTGQPVMSPVMLLGQAPGAHEGRLGRPFAWTAGKTLFAWLAEAGLDESAFRARAYMAAVCRCFPGKQSKGGDRVPDNTEIAACGEWLRAEVELLRPELVIPVGKLAITQMLACKKLSDVIGSMHRVVFHGHELDAVPLPHPSGVSTWHRTEPGKSLLRDALSLIREHPAWHRISGGD
jgi:uracil-DNA glycosylase